MPTNRILIVLIAIVLVACAPVPTNVPTATDVAPSTDVAAPVVSPTVAPVTSARERIKAIKNYVVFYGQGRVDELARYDLAIIQPNTLTSAELAQLKAQGTLVVAYLSVGEAEPGRAWYNDGRVNLQWLLDKNEDWGSYYVDAGQAGWQQLMADLTSEFIAVGFDGVFLDTIDTVDIFPDTKSGMITLIHGLRTTYPDALLVQNRGFSVAEEVAGDLDAIMFEDLATTYNFATSTYDYVDNSATAEEMVALQRQTGLPILALDYAPVDNPAMAYLATQMARNYGFIPAVSTINLDDIPDYRLDQNLPAEVRVSSITAESDGDATTLVATIENVGLADAAQVGLTLTVDGTELATDTRDLPIGAQVVWPVAWPDPQENAAIVVTATFADETPVNNTQSWIYSSAAMALEPLLPPDQQHRRPATNGSDMVITALTAPITIDGDLSDWEGYPCTTVDQVEQIGYGDPAQWSGPTDLSGHVCYAWDGANLYLGLNINDDIIVQRFRGSSLWKGDHVELWFDTQLQLDFDTNMESDDDFQLGLSPGDFDQVPPDFFIWTPAMFVDDYIDLVDYAVVQTPTGYAAELFIPARVLKGLRFASDHAIGGTFEPSDTDTPGGTDQELMMSTAPQSPQNWGNPTVWNNLIFQGEPAVTPRQVETTAETVAAIERNLSPLNQLPAAGQPSDVTAIIGYSFDPGDISQPIAPELLEQARATVRRAATEGALWLDADTGITNVADAFIFDPALTYYPLAEAIIDEAHRAGVKVFFYFSATEIETPDFAAQSGPAIHELYPDRPQVDQFSEPMVFEPGQLDFFWLEEDTADARMNPLDPGFFEVLAARSEKLAQLGADGLFYDVGYFFTIDNRWADFSPASAAAFKAATGHNLPVNLNADGKVYYEWLAWRHQVWADFYAALRERVQEANPDTLIIVEEYPGANPESIIETGLDPAVVERGVDIVAHEYDHKQDEGGAVAYDSNDWQHTRDVYKWYQGMNRVNWSLCYATQAEDSRALAAISYAHQQSFWETKAPTMLDESTGPEWRQALLGWLARHANALNRAQPTAEVAVLYSGRTRNLTYAASLSELVRVQHALDKSGLPYVILTEPNISRIHDFPYLILPDVTYITPAVQAEIDRYGGELLLVGDSFTRDGWNESDLEPPDESLSVNEAMNRITTTPLVIEGGEGLFVELFRRGNGIQIRLFNPDLNDDFMPEPRAITLRFVWPDDLPSITQLDFMTGEPVELLPVHSGDMVEVAATVGLMSIITIGE